ncbi:hypothetical protein D3C81_1704480 [compost metagenome]
MNADIIAAAGCFPVGLYAELLAFLYLNSAFGCDSFRFWTGCMIDYHLCMYLYLCPAALLQFNGTVHPGNGNHLCVSARFDAGSPFVKRISRLCHLNRNRRLHLSGRLRFKNSLIQLPGKHPASEPRACIQQHSCRKSRRCNLHGFFHNLIPPHPL